MNEDLINEVKALASEVHANETKEDQLRTQLAQICVDNFNQYIYPMLVQQREILDAISDTLQHYLNLDVYKKAVLVNTVKYNITIYCPFTHNNKLGFIINPIIEGTIVECKDKVKDIGGYWYNHADALSHFFGNEDAVQMTCGFINDLFVEQLNTIKKNCTDKNEKLKQIIDELTLRLSTAHVPVHKEDGTVEVMIGGKKFVGKLEEDTDGADDN